MKRTTRENITGLPYSLHDMRVTEMQINEDELTLKFADGFERIGKACTRVDGELCFHKVDWDFCFAYVLDFASNAGSFTGRKQFLQDFALENSKLDFEIVDETYGYNSSKFAGYLSVGSELKECNIEIYHLGAMEYVTRE